MFEKIKALFGKKEAPKKDVAASLANLNASAQPINPQASAPQGGGILNPALQGTPNLGAGMVSRADAQKLKAARKKTPIHILLLKYFSILLSAVTLGAFIFLMADLDPRNSYLSIVGVEQNTMQKAEGLKFEYRDLQEQVTQLDKRIKEHKSRLESQDFFVNRETINQIKESQLPWINEENAQGRIVTFGILDSISGMRDYFNDFNYTDETRILSANTIEIKKFFVTRNSADFTIEGKNLVGNVFFLSTEFIRMMKSFPFFKGDSIKNFTRKVSDDNEESTSFSLKLDIQGKEETDPFDALFENYVKWVNKSQDPISASSSRRTIRRTAN